MCYNFKFLFKNSLHETLCVLANASNSSHSTSNAAWDISFRETFLFEQPCNVKGNVV